MISSNLGKLLLLGLALVWLSFILSSYGQFFLSEGMTQTVGYDVDIPNASSTTSYTKLQRADRGYTGTIEPIDVKQVESTYTTIKKEFPFPETKSVREGIVKVGGIQYVFNPMEVKRYRPDLFNEGYFSVFDVLMHLHERGDVVVDYFFDESKNTHVIKSINEGAGWWHNMVYSGGWRERNVFRADHYPWKDDAILRWEVVVSSRINNAYHIFEDEVERKKGNNGKTIIPLVIIDGKTTNKRFKDVVVTAHNMRHDVFKEGTITALDVIMSLGDRDLIDYKLKWYESIGSAKIVKDYWVEGINRDITHGRCGFVYEAGSHKYEGFRGNHIHLPTDQRILNSPEYVEFFWICL